MPLIVVATGKAHRITQALVRGDGAVRNHFAAAAQTLHSQNSDATLLGLWQNLLFETSKSGVERVERHLNGVERKVVRKHFQMDRRIFVSGESDEANFAFLFGFHQRFGGAVWREKSNRDRCSKRLRESARDPDDPSAAAAATLRACCMAMSLLRPCVQTLVITKALSRFPFRALPSRSSLRPS